MKKEKEIRRPRRPEQTYIRTGERLNTIDRQYAVSKLRFALRFMSYILLFITIPITLQTFDCLAQPTKQWDKRFGGTGIDVVTALQQTTDGGYILGGSSTSGISGDKTQEAQASEDFWIVKIDANGTKQWDKRFGGSLTEQCYSIQQTSDGGYILGGISASGISGDKTEANRGAYDYWVVKTDANGNKQWDKTFGGSMQDVFACLQQTTDGGYLLGGTSGSQANGDKTQNKKSANNDWWIVKIDSNGTKQWDKDIGAFDADELHSLQQTTDGGYILGGFTAGGIGGDKTQTTQGGNDYWIVKIDANGTKQWDKRFGGSNYDKLYSLQQTSDGGYILGGGSAGGIDGDKTEANRGTIGTYDFWVVKTDANGNKQWDKTFGGSSYENIRSIRQTTDGGYILGGESNSPLSGDKTEAGWGGNDFWLVKTDANGTKQWDKRFGGSKGEGLSSLQQTSDGGYIFGGGSASQIISGDKTQANWSANGDMWIVKTGPICSVIANAGNDTTICKGDSATLTASGGSRYKWQTGNSADTLSTLTVSPVTTTTYTVTVTDSTCSKNTSVKITISSPLSPVGITPDSSIICKGDSIILNASNNNALQFSGGGYVEVAAGSAWLLNADKTISFWLKTNKTTQQYVMGTYDGGTRNWDFTIGNDGCQGTTGKIYWYIANCSGGPTSTTTVTDDKWHHITFTYKASNGSASVYVDGKLEKTGSGSGNINTNSKLAIGSLGAISPYNSGNFKGELDEIQVWNYVRSQAEIQASMYTPIDTKTTGLLAYWRFDEGKGVTVADLTGNGYNGTLTGSGIAWQIPSTSPMIYPVSYSWAPAMGLSNTSANTTIAKPASTTTYIITATAACEVTKDTITVKVNAVTPVINGITNICIGDSTTLTATGGNKYIWSTGDTLAIINVKPMADSTYRVVVSDGNCTDSTSTEIIPNPIPTPNAGKDTSICIGNTVILNADGGASYLWTPATGLSDTTLATPIATPTATTPYIVQVANGGCVRTDTVVISVNTLPTVSAGEDVTITSGSSITLAATGAVKYLWTPITGLSDATTYNPIANPKTTTVYSVRGTDSNGCMSMDSVIVTLSDSVIVTPTLPCEVSVPNAFSPNADGKNDFVKVHGNCIKELSFSIYDRWGEEVFKATNLSTAMTKGWDGTYKEKTMNTAVFVYYLTATLSDGTAFTKKGNISLIR